MNGNFKDDNHALLAGMAIGVLMQAGMDAEPEIDNAGDYTDVIQFTDQTGEYIFRVKVLPAVSS